MREYLSEEYQILMGLLGTWDMIELIESYPTSPCSLHHFDICEIEWKCAIETRPDNSIREDDLC